MNETIIVGIITGSLLPFIIKWLNTDITNKKVKYSIAILVSIASGLAVCLGTGKIESSSDIISICGIVFGASQTFFIFLKDKLNL